jgi:hypothetical protein
LLAGLDCFASLAMTRRRRDCPRGDDKMKWLDRADRRDLLVRASAPSSAWGLMLQIATRKRAILRQVEQKDSP